MTQYQFSSLDDMSSWLKAAGIDTSAWGRGTAKSVGDLWQEYIAGESAFEDHPPARLVEVAQVIIRRSDAVLLEIAQEFADGRRRERMQPPSEKLKRGEEPLAATLRCLSEELGLSPRKVVIERIHPPTEQTIDSPSYPGLPTCYRMHMVDVTAASLPDEDFFRDNAAPGDPIRRHIWGWRR